MIKITIFQDQKKQYHGFCCAGHAEYARSGEDIICAGVSALVINTINAIDRFTDDTFRAKTDPGSGFIDIRFHHLPGHDTRLLIRTMILGLQDIQDKYGTSYCFLNFEEV